MRLIRKTGLALLAWLGGCMQQDVTGTQGYKLAQSNGCFICHEIAAESYCPRWKDVASKYRGDGSAEKYLADKIGNGGSGVWGALVMPPHPQISVEDRHKLAGFVLSL